MDQREAAIQEFLGNPIVKNVMQSKKLKPHQKKLQLMPYLSRLDPQSRKNIIAMVNGSAEQDTIATIGSMEMKSLDALGNILPALRKRSPLERAEIIDHALGDTDEEAARIKEIEERVGKKHKASPEHYAKFQEALKKFNEWCALKEFHLEPNEHSRLHKLIEATHAPNEYYVFSLMGEVESVEEIDHSIEGSQLFVVKHNWAAAFEGATFESTKINDNAALVEQFNLPFDHCIFELRISGVTVLALLYQLSEQQLSDTKYKDFFVNTNGIMMSCFFGVGDFWFCDTGARDPDSSAVFVKNGIGSFSAPENPLDIVWKQVRAICIALDAEVATYELHRQPAALNDARTKAGKVPLYDFHIVDLSKRHRTDFNGGGTHRSPRLHFRRGHWRHYPTHKTWIKWMLVGNPELGFVEKSYKL
jgi:hypothetical protein